MPRRSAGIQAVEPDCQEWVPVGGVLERIATSDDWVRPVTFIGSPVRRGQELEILLSGGNYLPIYRPRNGREHRHLRCFCPILRPAPPCGDRYSLPDLGLSMIPGGDPGGGWRFLFPRKPV